MSGSCDVETRGLVHTLPPQVTLTSQTTPSAVAARKRKSASEFIASATPKNTKSRQKLSGAAVTADPAVGSPLLKNLSLNTSLSLPINYNDLNNNSNREAAAGSDAVAGESALFNSKHLITAIASVSLEFA